MGTYLMFGRYTAESAAKISAKRTQDASKLMKEMGGKLVGGYAMLGDKDLLLITEFADTGAVMKASVALSKMLGIAFSTAPAVTIEEFDKLVG
jgi:uncharacterized protein with GYD domain